jgi:hypothetical protein
VLKGFLFFILTFLISIDSFALNECHSLFAQNGLWSSSKTAEARIQGAIAHQNALRRQAEVQIAKVRGELVDLPQLKLKFEKDDLSAPLKVDQNEMKYWIEQGYPEQSSSGQFFVEGNLMIRASYNDVWGLNFVYRFEGSRLVEMKPFVQWQLERMPNDTVTLYRSMNEAELALWKSGAIDKLGAPLWGFGEADGTVQNAIHFSVKPWSGQRQVKIQIPKSKLLEFAQKTPKQLWAGALTENAKTLEEVENFEFILSRTVLLDLHAKKMLSVEFND